MSLFVPQRFLDPATEFDLFRLTDPRYNAWLPASHLHFISRRGKFLIYVSDASGFPQAYRLDWRSGQSRQLTTAAALDRRTPALSPDDRSLCYFDGPVLMQLTLANLRERPITSVPNGWQRTPGFAVSSDAGTAVWVEQKDAAFRIRTVSLARGEAATVVESTARLADPQFRPGHLMISYRSGAALRTVHLDGGADTPAPSEPGKTVGQAVWSPDGATLLYLAVPEERTQLITLRELAMEPAADRLVAKTSQFASFGVNGDSSVFVGASRSIASPYIILLLRSVRRELTLCEHRSSDAASVEPVFSPDSQSIFFTSDRRGKRCVYRAHVEKFVEETGEGPAETQ